MVVLRLDQLSGHLDVDMTKRLVQTLAGYDVLVPYVIEGSPKPDVTWYKDGHRLQSNPILEYSDKLLTMRRTITADEGFYQIAAKNVAGESRSSFRLRVVCKT